MNAKTWRPKILTVENRGGESCKIWNLQISRNENDSYFAILEDGLINNISASNIGDEVSITENGFLNLSVTANGAAVSSFVLEFSQQPPAAIPDSEGVPVSSFGILLARVSGFAAIPNFCRSISAIPIVSRIEEKVPEAPGQLNTTNFYTWKINES